MDLLFRMTDLRLRSDGRCRGAANVGIVCGRMDLMCNLKIRNSEFGIRNFGENFSKKNFYFIVFRCGGERWDVGIPLCGW